MANFEPSVSDVHVDALLTELSIAYINDPAAFIGEQLFPIVRVKKQSDIILKYDKNDFLRDEVALRGPGTESEGSGFDIDKTTTYFCKEYAFHKDIPDQIRSNADAPISIDKDATVYVTEKMRIKTDQLVVNAAFASSVWGTDKTVTNQWSDQTNGDPIGDIETGKDTVHASTARDPNKLAVGRNTWTQMKHHPDFVDRVKYTQLGIVDTGLVGQVVGIPNLLVGNTIKATNAEGATAAYAEQWGKHALLAFTPESPSLFTPSAGYVFRWIPEGLDVRIRRLRMDLVKSDRIEAEMNVDVKVIGTDLGYFFPSVVA